MKWRRGNFCTRREWWGCRCGLKSKGFHLKRRPPSGDPAPIATTRVSATALAAISAEPIRLSRAQCAGKQSDKCGLRQPGLRRAGIVVEAACVGVLRATPRNRAGPAGGRERRDGLSNRRTSGTRENKRAAIRAPSLASIYLLVAWILFFSDGTAVEVRPRSKSLSPATTA